MVVIEGDGNGWVVSASGERRWGRYGAAGLLLRAADPAADDEGLDMVETAVVADWDAEVERLLAEARDDRSDVIEVPVPSSLSATAVLRLHDDPEGLPRDLARPMPRRWCSGQTCTSATSSASPVQAAAAARPLAAVMPAVTTSCHHCPAAPRNP